MILEFWMVVVAVAICITILAFVLKDNVFYSPMLHAVALLGWLIGTFLMVKAAIDQYHGDEQITLAVGLFGISMVIVETVAIILPYLRQRKTDKDVYNTRQKAFRDQIAGMTQKKEKMWWQ